ncbi:MAG: FtsH protease activity modulator HflK [Deltaproteobacteria bacterium]|nr:FtsH protease activity modulator HflK [Deltaproteobacteria bacterium]
MTLLNILKDEKHTVLQNIHRIIYIALAILIVFYIASGVCQIETNEQAVIRRFGKFYELVNPGIYYALPWPIDTVDKIKIKEIKSIEVGFWSTNLSNATDLPIYAITGDKNIIHNRYIIQYRISEPQKYLFSCEKPEKILEQISRSVILKIVANRKVDTLLTTGKIDTEHEIHKNLTDAINKASLGFSIASVSTSMAVPPITTRQAFEDVANAREEMKTSNHMAEAHRNTVIPEANTKALNLIEQAKSYKYRRTTGAQGESERFLKVYDEYIRSPKIMKDRTLIEVLEKFLPKAKIIIQGTDKQGRLTKLRLIQGVMPTKPQLPKTTVESINE